MDQEKVENTEAVQEIPSSNFPGGDVEGINKEHLIMSSWLLMGVLVVLFFLLKSFIYIKDEKRHGK